MSQLPSMTKENKLSHARKLPVPEVALRATYDPDEDKFGLADEW